MEGTNVTHYSQTVFAEIMWMNSSDGWFYGKIMNYEAVSVPN
jgi:hypothetical protein